MIEPSGFAGSEQANWQPAPHSRSAGRACFSPSWLLPTRQDTFEAGFTWHLMHVLGEEVEHSEHSLSCTACRCRGGCCRAPGAAVLGKDSIPTGPALHANSPSTAAEHYGSTLLRRSCLAYNPKGVRHCAECCRRADACSACPALTLHLTHLPFAWSRVVPP